MGACACMCMRTSMCMCTRMCMCTSVIASRYSSKLTDWQRPPWLQAMVSQPTKQSIDLNCADSMGLTQPSARCRVALAAASDEAGATANER